MNKKFNVLIYCDEKKSSQIVKSLQNAVNIISVCRNTIELSVYLKDNREKFVVICDFDENVSEIEYLFNIIKSTDLKVICMCKDVAEGFRFLEKGACDIIVLKNDLNLLNNTFISSIILKIKKAYGNIGITDNRIYKQLTSPYKECGFSIIAFGSSTGGTQAITHILQELPQNIPPIVIVQHMPPVFTKLFAERLNDICNLTVWEGKDGDLLRPGLAIVAPGDMQTSIYKAKGELYLSCKKDEAVNGHSPSADVLFYSVAQECKDQAIGVILTGMGKDGAQGLLKIKESGGYTIGQDKESSVVYGMPKEAFELGAVDLQADFSEIPAVLKGILKYN